MVCRLLIPYGCTVSRQTARNLLENRPDILRMDIIADNNAFRLFSSAPLSEFSLLSVLSDSGLDGFELR